MILMNVSMISYIQIAIVKLNSWNSNFDNIPNPPFVCKDNFISNINITVPAIILYV